MLKQENLSICFAKFQNRTQNVTKFVNLFVTKSYMQQRKCEINIRELTFTSETYLSKKL